MDPCCNSLMRKYTIRKIKPRKWRGYENGVRIIEFTNTSMETAEQAAERWSTSQNLPKNTKPAESRSAAREFVKHVKIDCEGVIRRGLQHRRDFVELYRDMQKAFRDQAYAYEVCLHEAAHAVLMEKDGIQNVRFSG